MNFFINETAPFYVDYFMLGYKFNLLKIIK